MDPIIISLLAFLAVGGLVATALYILRGGDGTRAAERLDALVGRGGRRESSTDLLLKQALSEVDKKSVLDSFAPNLVSLERVFEQADANIRPSALFAIAVGMALVGGGLSSVIARTIYVAPVGAAIFFGVPWLWLWNKRRKRLKAFAGQLPDALELVARALRGITQRVPNLDLRFFVTSVAIQRQTGGDLAEILDKIGHVIRERYRILGQVKALTAEGRLSGLVLIALPFGLFLLMLHMKPDYISLLWTDPLGVKMSVFALVLQVLGAYSIKKIVDIKV